MSEASAVREPDFLWHGRPVYRSRCCGDRFERVENLPAVLKHEREAHATPATEPRESSILGPDGKPAAIA